MVEVLLQDLLVLDKVLSLKYGLNFSGIEELFKFFVPVIFNLSVEGQEWGLTDEGFVYPTTMRLSLSEVQTCPLVLIDTGLSLHLVSLEFPYKSRLGPVSQRPCRGPGVTGVSE